jgi:hypothetical protein
MKAPELYLHPNIAGDLIDTKRRATQNHRPVLNLRNLLNEY